MDFRQADLSSKHCDDCFPLVNTAMHLFDQGVHVVMLMTRRKHIEHADSWLGDSPCFFLGRMGKGGDFKAWPEISTSGQVSRFFPAWHRYTHFIVFVHLAYRAFVTLSVKGPIRSRMQLKDRIVWDLCFKSSSFKWKLYQIAFWFWVPIGLVGWWLFLGFKR